MFSVDRLLKNLFTPPSKGFFSQSWGSRYRRRQEAPSLASAEIEVLESRVLLTGNVHAAVIGGDLVIDGGNGDDHIALQIQDGNLIVRGFNGTTVNGGSSFLAIAGDATLQGDLRIHMGAGDDTILIGPGIEVGDDVSIDTGSEDDIVNIEGLSVDDDLTIRTGSGNDIIFLNEVSVGDDQRIFSGSGNDVVKVSNGNVRDNLWIGTAEGNDTAVVVETAIGDHGALITGRGNDTLGRAGNSTGSRFVASGGTGQNQNITNLNDIDDLSAITNAENEINGLINPTAVDDSYVLAADVDLLTVNAGDGLLSNDLLSTLVDPLSASLETEPSNGEVTVDPDGSFVYTPDADFAGIDTFTYTVTGAFGGTDEGSVEITVETFLFDIDITNNDTIQSNGILLTKEDTFHIEGVTLPGATIEIDLDGDNAFDDGTAVADGDGLFSIDVTLIHDDSNHGANALQVRSSSANSNRQRIHDVDVHLAIGTVARFNSSLGTFDIELLDDDAPNTVANFLNYATSGRYDDSIIHRAVDNFVIQGGGLHAGYIGSSTNCGCPYGRPHSE